MLLILLCLEFVANPPYGGKAPLTMIFNLFAFYLTKECFDTMMVHDGEQALAAFDTYHPNLILLDLYPVQRSPHPLSFREG